MTRSAPIPVTSKDYAATAAVSRADTTSPFNSTRSTKSTKPSTAVACLSPSSSVQSSFVKILITQQRGHQTIHGSKPQHSCFLKTAL